MDENAHRNSPPTLRTLNLSANAIVCAPTWLAKLEKRLSSLHPLKEVVIDNNFLDPKCEIETLLHPIPEPTTHFRYGLFSSRVRPSKSLLEPQSKEGMRLSGQKFLERYDLRAIAMVGQAGVSIERFDPAHFACTNYLRATKRISEAQGISV